MLYLSIRALPSIHPFIHAFVWIGASIAAHIELDVRFRVCAVCTLCTMSKFILIRWVLDNALDVCPLSALESKEIRERLTNDADAIGPLRGSRVDVNRWEEPEEAIIIDAGKSFPLAFL